MQIKSHQRFAPACRALRKELCLSLSAAVAFVAVACGSDTKVASSDATAAVCDLSVKPTCPTSPPSYATEVSGLFEKYCLQCHDPNGVGAITGSSHAPPPGDANHRPYAENANTFNANAAHWDPSAQRDWSNFKNIVQYATQIQAQVYLCKMPPTGATQMTAADRITMMNWLACGAPDN